MFDGRYVYYVPYYNATAYDGIVMRFDPQSAAGFADKSSWTSFDTATLTADDNGYYGAAFDGRYLYFEQHYDGSVLPPSALSYGAYIVRYDTRRRSPRRRRGRNTCRPASTRIPARRSMADSFTSRVTSPGSAYEGVSVRYDTQAGFTDPSAWSDYDASALNAHAKGWDGAACDGQYVYMVPDYDGVPEGVVVRFEAKSASWLPRSWNNTFE